MQARKLRRKGIVRVGADAVGQALQIPLRLTARILQCQRVRLDTVLKFQIRPGFENLPENGGAGGGISQQQFLKRALRDHGDLAELIPIHAQQFRNRAGHIGGFYTGARPSG